MNQLINYLLICRCLLWILILQCDRRGRAVDFSVVQGDCLDQIGLWWVARSTYGSKFHQNVKYNQQTSFSVVLPFSSIFWGQPQAKSRFWGRKKDQYVSSNWAGHQNFKSHENDQIQYNKRVFLLMGFRRVFVESWVFVRHWVLHPRWVGLGVGNLPGNSRNFQRIFWNFRNGPDLLKFSEITEILKSLKIQ